MEYSGIFDEMKTLLAQRAELQRRVNRAMGRAEGLKTSRLDGMPKGGKRSETFSELELLADLVRERDEVERLLTAYRQRVEPLVDALPAGPRRVALRLRYVDWLSVEEVARRAGYERRYMYRLLDSAEKLVLPAVSEVPPPAPPSHHSAN